MANGKDTFYFSHDYNARNDEKTKALIRRHGMPGYGIFWCIIEDLYNNANALRTDYDGFAYDLHSDANTIKSIINDFGLFVFDGDTFGSLSVQRRLAERNTKSEKARLSALKRWREKKDDANALRTQSEGNAIKERKERKKEKEEEKKPTFNFKAELQKLGVSEQVATDWMEVRKAKKASNTPTAFNGVLKQIQLSGLPPDECIRIAAERSWTGFNAEWVKDKQTPQQPKQDEPRPKYFRPLN
jgi:hypothetical protein